MGDERKNKEHGINKKNCSNLKQKKRKICIINKSGFTTNTGMKRQKCNMH